MLLATSLVLDFPRRGLVSSFCLWKILSNTSIPKKNTPVGQQTKPTTVRYFGDIAILLLNLRGVGFVHYFEYFLERGILGAKHLRLLTRPLGGLTAYRSAFKKNGAKKHQKNGDLGRFATSVAIETFPVVFLVLLICLQVAELQSMPEMT